MHQNVFSKVVILLQGAQTQNKTAGTLMRDTHNPEQQQQQQHANIARGRLFGSTKATALQALCNENRQKHGEHTSPQDTAQHITKRLACCNCLTSNLTKFGEFSEAQEQQQQCHLAREERSLQAIALTGHAVWHYTGQETPIRRPPPREQPEAVLGQYHYNKPASKAKRINVA
jgi:hypothetical protein